jgi:Peptidase C65 Otubain
LLKKKYAGWRAVLDDGNSFFRALFVGFLESCIQTSDGDAVLRLCDSLEAIAGTDGVREWLVSGFAKPLLRLSGKVSDASLEALDAFLAENATFDEDIMKAMRKLTAKYISDHADAVEKDDMTLEEELLAASGGGLWRCVLTLSVNAYDVFVVSG